MPEQMSGPEVKQFVYAMEAQGVGITRTKKGLLLRLPNGDSTAVHFTNSDVRAEKNLIAVLRRAGVVHPKDTRGIAVLPPNITESGQPAVRTKQAILDYVADTGYPEVVQVMGIVQSKGMEHVTVSRALYHMGFLPTKGKKGGRDWITPDDIMANKPVEEEEPPVVEASVVDRALSFDDAPVNPSKEEAAAYWEAISDSPAEKVQLSGDREFIDSVDSWVIDLTEHEVNPFSQPLTTVQFFQMLRTAGLEYEVRVWRKK